MHSDYSILKCSLFWKQQLHMYHNKHKLQMAMARTAMLPNYPHTIFHLFLIQSSFLSVLVGFCCNLHSCFEREVPKGGQQHVCVWGLFYEILGYSWYMILYRTTLKFLYVRNLPMKQACQLTVGVFMYAPAAQVVHSFVEFVPQVQYLFISISLKK